jgi:sugar phosphate isomerase/epimerase
MRIAINAQQLAATHTLAQILDVLARFGVDAIELWPANIPILGGHATTPESAERYETRDVATAAALLRDRGITVACVTLGFWAAPRCIARAGVVALSDALIGAVDAAHTLGAQLVNAYSTGIPLTLWGTAVAPAAAYAAARGVVITLENEAHDESGLPHQVAALCNTVASVACGTQYDPCNYYHAGVEPYPAAYATVRDHIRYVHLKGGCHFDPRSTMMHRGSLMRDRTDAHIGYVPLPEAAFPVEAIVRRLQRDGYTGFITLEPHVSGETLLAYYAQEIPYLRALLAATDAQG